jgi:hypothetical protein
MGVSDAIDEYMRWVAKYWSPPSWWALIVTVPWLVGLLLGIGDFVTGQKIAGRQRTTYGIVRAHEPANHDRYGYEFVVNGKVFTGWQSPKADYDIGQGVRVYYDPLDPTRNSLSSFDEDAGQSVGLISAGALGTVAFTVVIFVRRRAHARRSPAKP